MQRERQNSVDLLHGLSCYASFENMISLEERKDHQTLHQLFNSNEKKVQQVKGRGKGRPKGEKNSKNRERKTKDALKEENRKKGHWSVEENKKYHWFLEMYHQHFIHKEMRRLDKIFKTMATFIGSREAEQCRSHHQKMEKKYLSFPRIIFYLRQVHYKSDDPWAIEEDIRNNYSGQQFTLIDPQYLLDLSSPKLSSPAPTVHQKEERKHSEICSLFPDSPHLPINTFDDILGNNYQLQFDLENLLL